jgi:hypothetical protein
VRSATATTDRTETSAPGHDTATTHGSRPSLRQRAWTRRRLRVALGGLWLIDGLLQLQPFMFTKGLALQILAPSGDLQPSVVRVPVGVLVRLVVSHPAAFNAGFAAAEIAVGLGLICLRASRASRYVSGGAIALALGIWWLGEGLGGIANGRAAVAMGAPGAAAIYALVGLVAWPRKSNTDRAGDADLPARWLPVGWFVLWTATAAMSVLPAQNSADGLAGQALMGSLMSPDVLRRPEFALSQHASRLSPTSAALVAGVLGLLQVAIAVGGFLRGRIRRAAAITGVAFALVCWVLGQGFGGISTGQATDLGTGPVLVLLAFALLARNDQGSRSGAQVISSNFSRTA